MADTDRFVINQFLRRQVTEKQLSQLPEHLTNYLGALWIYGGQNYSLPGPQSAAEVLASNHIYNKATIQYLASTTVDEQLLLKLLLASLVESNLPLVRCILTKNKSVCRLLGPEYVQDVLLKFTIADDITTLQWLLDVFRPSHTIILDLALKACLRGYINLAQLLLKKITLANALNNHQHLLAVLRLAVRMEDYDLLEQLSVVELPDPIRAQASLILGDREVTTPRKVQQ